MHRLANHSRISRFKSLAGKLLIITAVLFCSTGVSCDDEAATTFRQTATSAIGSGVKTIVNGILDGVIAAVEQAGDGTSSSD